MGRINHERCTRMAMPREQGFPVDPTKRFSIPTDGRPGKARSVSERQAQSLAKRKRKVSLATVSIQQKGAD
jgi:hypothetical protein